MMISNFDELIAAAKAQANDQHLILVYTVAELPEDATPQQRADFEAGYGGALVPVACVDKKREELTSFADLCVEARDYVPEWNVLFAGALDVPPLETLSDDKIDQTVETVLAKIKAGQFETLIPFDANGQTIDLSQ